MSQQPVPETRPACARLGAGRSVVSYLALLPMGFSLPPRLLSERWALTPPFHPCRRHTEFTAAVYFLWHYPSKSLTTFLPRVSARGQLRGIAPYGVRTFLPGFAPEAILRPSKISLNLAECLSDDKFSSNHRPGAGTPGVGTGGAVELGGGPN